MDADSTPQLASAAQSPRYNPIHPTSLSPSTSRPQDTAPPTPHSIHSPNVQSISESNRKKSPGIRERARIELADRPTYYQGGWKVTPQIHYFTVHDTLATDEFNVKVAHAMTSFMIGRGYETYAFGLVHAGYDKSSVIPIVYAAVPDFDEIDAIDLTTNVFPLLECQYISHLVPFRGAFYPAYGETTADLQFYCDPAPLGCSIGVENSDRAFSSGLTIRPKNSTEKYNISVHHGIREADTPVVPSNPVPIHQPSPIETTTIRRRWTDLLDLSTEYYSEVPLPSSPHPFRNHEYYDALLKELDSQDSTFGTACYSHLDVVDYDSKRVRRDIVLIDISNSSRVISNTIPFNDPVLRHEYPTWNVGRVYVNGIAEMKLGEEVLKTGRSTGVTYGTVRFLCDRVKFRLASERTVEFTVIIEPGTSLFGRPGDSGSWAVNKAGNAVGMVIGGIDMTPDVLRGYETYGALHTTHLTPMGLIRDAIEGWIGEFEVVPSIV
jgi:Peptidase family S64